MTLADIAAVANLLSAVAVLGTLVHLTIQLRQNDRNQRAAVQQGMAAHVTDLMLRATEPDMAAILTRARAGAANLTPAETTQLMNFLRVCMIGFQDGYFHNRSSLYSAGYLDMQDRHMKWLLSAPVYRALWEAQKEMFSREFVAYVDAAIADLQPSPNLDFSTILGAKPAKARRKRSASPV